NHGDLAEAVKVFAAVLRLDPRPRWARRAALCCLAAGDLGAAEAHARHAAGQRPDDPSYGRVLAEVLRATGQLDEAEAVLVRALDLAIDSDVLARELETELATVRAKRT